MVKYKFRSELEEYMVMCANCRKSFHERCVLHMRNYYDTYYCVNCRHFVDFRFDRLQADRIPTTDCDVFITEFMERYHSADFRLKFTVRMLK